MKPTFESGCKELTDELAKLVIKKQKDYGKGNILAFGEYGVLVRLNDKVERLKNLIGKKEPQNESIYETWQDVAGYAIIALILREGWFELPLEDLSAEALAKEETNTP